MICTVLISCSNDNNLDNEELIYKGDETPKITVKYDDTYIDYHAALNCWNNALYDRLDSVVYIMENSNFDNIPYLENDTVIEIIFSKMPDSITVKDTLVDEDGKLKHDYRAAVIDVEQIRIKKLI